MKNLQPKALSDREVWTPRQMKANAFGSQVRSYVLDRNEVIDHRTGKRAEASAVLNGNVNLIR